VLKEVLVSKLLLLFFVCKFAIASRGCDLFCTLEKKGATVLCFEDLFFSKGFKNKTRPFLFQAK